MCNFLKNWNDHLTPIVSINEVDDIIEHVKK